MNGINSHTHDPICRGESYQVFSSCELCSVVMPEDALEKYDGYRACSECIESSEEEKKEESDYLNGLRAGRTELAIELLNELEGDTRKIVLETISRLQA